MFYRVKTLCVFFFLLAVIVFERSLIFLIHFTSFGLMGPQTTGSQPFTILHELHLLKLPFVSRIEFIRYMKQTELFRLFHVSNLSLLNFGSFWSYVTGGCCLSEG